MNLLTSLSPELQKFIGEAAINAGGGIGAEFATCLLDGAGRRVHDVKAFYTGLRDLPGLLPLVQPLGLTSERIEQGIQNLQSLDQLYQEALVHADRLALIQQQRDAAYTAIYQWMNTFRKVARAGLANYPIYLARLGMKGKSDKATNKDEVPTESEMRTIPLMESVSMVATA